MVGTHLRRIMLGCDAIFIYRNCSKISRRCCISSFLAEYLKVDKAYLPWLASSIDVNWYVPGPGISFFSLTFGSVFILWPMPPPKWLLGTLGSYLSGLGEFLVRLRAYNRNEPKVTWSLPGPRDATLLYEVRSKSLWGWYTPGGGTSFLIKRGHFYPYPKLVTLCDLVEGRS